MGESYACFKKITHVLITFDIKQSIAQISKIYTSLDSPVHKKYKHFI